MPDQGPSRRPGRRTKRAAVLGLLANVALAITKLVAGVAGSSYALVADAVESIGDILGSVVIWGGLHMGSRPPDEKHPYGHGRIESLAALAVAVLIGAAGIGIAVQAVRGLFEPQLLPAPFTLIVLIAVVLVKEGMARFAGRAAEWEQSVAGRLDSWHHRSDALSSLAAAIGITTALIGGPDWAVADEWAALFASGIIVFNAWYLSRTPLRELTDAEPTDIVEEAAALAIEVPGVRAVETVHARRHGRDTFIDMHIEVDPELTVRAAHKLAHDAQDAVRAGLPRVQQVLVHVEPHDPPGPGPGSPDPPGATGPA